MEEMEIEIEILNPEPFITYASKKTNGGETGVILIHFLARRVGKIKPGDDIQKWDWHDLNNLPNNLAPSIKPVLKQFRFLE